MTNPEYGIMDGSHYIPGPGLVDCSLTDVEILPKKDSSQGVSVYDKGTLVAHISGKSNNDILTMLRFIQRLLMKMEALQLQQVL